MKRAVLALVLLLALCAPSHGSDPAAEAMSILERWTSFHWGRDCLVWVVHYPEELVGPWVEAEAARSGMTEAEREQYRRSFSADLRIETAEAFLLTVYVFSPRPLNLGPLASSVMLETGDGRKIPPSSYEKKFDQPLVGIVQGLVFFPKQQDKDFKLIIRNLGVLEEQYFAFDGREPVMVASAAVEQPEQEVVVVELPPAPKKAPEKPAPPKPTPELPPPPPPPPPVATPEDLADLAPKPTVDLPVPKKDPVLYISKEKTLENFLRHWIEGETSAMYDLLTDANRTALTEEQFARQVQATGLRQSLREGYKIQWMDDGRARVVTAQRMLLFRTLRSKVLTLGREGAEWRVGW